MGTKNYGAGYREMGRAGEIKLQQACQRKEISFATANKYSDDWKQFCAWAKENGAKQMERITKEMVVQYGRELAQKADDNLIKSSTGQDRVTAVNRVLQLAGRTDWKSVSSTKDCGIEKRCHIRQDTPETLDRKIYEERLEAVREIGGERGAAICELARNLGLRSKEASLFDARSGLKSAEERGFVVIDAGTKGGRPRELEINTPRQFEALKTAAQAQGNAKAVMPPDQNWKEWRQGDLREIRETIGGLHELRSAYACERYTAITGHEPPCAGKEIRDRDIDYGARLVISDELGHGRTDVVSEYIGGRR